jgi:hypothetical protein
MYANTCWGLLCLAVTFGLAVLGLPIQYEWLSPWLLGAAVACGIGSLICFSWPLRQKANRDRLLELLMHPYRAAKLIEPSHIMILGLVIALGGVIWQSRKASLASGVVPALVQGNDTHLGLKFGPRGTTPTATDQANVWRWYALQSVAVAILPDGPREIKSWSLFITFEKPVDAKQVIIEGAGLPQYEVKDRDSRSVIIAFLGDILDTSLNVRIDSGSGTKADAPKRDTPAEIQSSPTPTPAPSAPPSRPLTAYEAEKKLPVIDAFLAILQDDMQPTINDGPRLQTNWWNAIKDPTNNPKYGEELIAYRDLIKNNLNKLDQLRDRNPQYQDVIVAVQQTYWNTVIPAVEKFLIAYQLASTQLKPAASEAMQFLMKEPSDGFGKAIQDFTQWRNTARSRLIEIRRSISP